MVAHSVSLPLLATNATMTSENTMKPMPILVMPPRSPILPTTTITQPTTNRITITMTTVPMMPLPIWDNVLLNGR